MAQTLNAKHGSKIELTREAIRLCESFKTYGALSGDTITHGAGSLRGAELDRYCDDVNSIDYVVMSYATPIAWHTPNGWYIVEQKFSVTTSSHQGLVRYALA